MRHLLPGEDARQLFGTAGRVFGRDHAQLKFHARRGVLFQRPLQRGNRFRLVVLNADDHPLRAQDMAEDAGAGNDRRGVLLHQPVIGGDVRFTFGSVDDQRFHAVPAALQFGGGGEARAAETGDARLVDARDQVVGALLVVIRHRRQFTPAVFAVGIQHHAQLFQAGGVGGDARLNGAHGAGGRRVYRQCAPAPGGQRLTFQHRVTGTHQQLTLRAEVLLQRDDKGVAERRSTQRRVA